MKKTFVKFTSKSGQKKCRQKIRKKITGPDAMTNVVKALNIPLPRFTVYLKIVN